MGKRGPKPKPTALRVFEGDPGRLLSKRDGEPRPPSAFAVPEPPEWLGEVGKAKWCELAPKLHPVNLLTDVDRGLLALYCEAWDEFTDSRKLIAQSGLVAVSEKGGEYQHPAVGIKNKAVARIKQLGAEFGLSPAARVGLNVNAGSKPSGLAALKKNG